MNFEDDIRENIKEIISYAKSIKSTVKLYEEKDEAVDFLQFDIGYDEVGEVRGRVIKRCRQRALEALGDMEAEIAVLKKRLENWR